VKGLNRVFLVLFLLTPFLLQCSSSPGSSSGGGGNSSSSSSLSSSSGGSEPQLYDNAPSGGLPDLIALLAHGPSGYSSDLSNYQQVLVYSSTASNGTYQVITNTPDPGQIDMIRIFIPDLTPGTNLYFKMLYSNTGTGAVSAWSPVLKCATSSSVYAHKMTFNSPGITLNNPSDLEVSPRGTNIYLLASNGIVIFNTNGTVQGTAGSYSTSAPGGLTEFVKSLAVDLNEFIYAYDSLSSHTNVIKYNPDGTFLTNIFLPGGLGNLIAVDGMMNIYKLCNSVSIDKCSNLNAVNYSNVTSLSGSGVSTSVSNLDSIYIRHLHILSNQNLLVTHGYGGLRIFDKNTLAFVSQLSNTSYVSDIKLLNSAVAPGGEIYVLFESIPFFTDQLPSYTNYYVQKYDSTGNYLNKTFLTNAKPVGGWQGYYPILTADSAGNIYILQGSGFTVHQYHP
jgi:hypothetical protein